MEAVERRQPLRARERALRGTGSVEERDCGVAGRHRSWGGEIGPRGAERRSTQRYLMRCSVPCMPVESKAGNRITWNHFFFVPAFESACHSTRSLPDWKYSLAAGRPARKIARSARALDRRRVSLWRLAFARGGSCTRRLPRLELLRLSRTGLMSRKPPQGYRDLHR